MTTGEPSYADMGTSTMCCTSTISATQQNSPDELNCYRKLYGDLIDHVPHYNRGWRIEYEQQ